MKNNIQFNLIKDYILDSFCPALTIVESLLYLVRNQLYHSSKAICRVRDEMETH